MITADKQAMNTASLHIGTEKPGRWLALSSDLLSSLTLPSRYQQVNVTALLGRES